MENTYNEKLCEERHSNINKKFEGIDKRLDDHSDRIENMEKANIKLTEILERVTNPKKVSFWDSKVGQAIPWLVFTVVILTIAALVGTNILDVLKAIPTVK